MESRGRTVKTVTVVSVGDTPAGVIAELARAHGIVQVVRRCPELSELLAACQSGLAQVAVVAEFGEELTATLIDRLTAVGVIVVAVAASPEESRRLRGAGATTVPEHVTVETLAEMIRVAVEGRRHPGSSGYSVPTAPSDIEAQTTQRYDGGHQPSTTIDGAGVGAKVTNPHGVAPAGAEPGAGDVAETARQTPPEGSAAPNTHGEEPTGQGRMSSRGAAIGTRGGPRSGPRADLATGHGLKARITAGLHLRGRDFRRRHPAPERTFGPADQHSNGTDHRTESGTIVAVWGPTGSPGRTTVAINLAAEQAAAGRKVLLIDADTYGASVAAALGLLDEAASFAQACRAADQGGLGVAHLAKTATQVIFDGGTFSLLTGLTRADRWPELRAAAVERVLAAARELADLVIVDCGFALENDEELSYDTVAPRRNAATLAVLRQSDVVYAVGNSDPIGIPRLIRGLDELGQACPGACVRVVVNKVRRKAVGGSPERSLVQAWERFGPEEGIRHFLPWDPELTDKALLEGRLLRELSVDAPLSLAIRGMSCAADQ
ncbi:AAA family ATPase [Arthrobacter sp. TWP1-1]|uniref:AAA family ATPase n=1 Tax=Arthrobacter sp. TWP1-1 TaxID=2804568 RepID=UPI003CF2B743